MAVKKRTRVVTHKNSILPAHGLQKPTKQIEHNWKTQVPRQVAQFNAATLSEGALVLCKGQFCVLLAHTPFRSDRADLLFPDGRRIGAVPYRWISLPSEACGSRC